MLAGLGSEREMVQFLSECHVVNCCNFVQVIRTANAATRVLNTGSLTRTTPVKAAGYARSVM